MGDGGAQMGWDTYEAPPETVHQVHLGPAGDPALAQASGMVHVVYSEVFWPPLGGNTVESCLGGKQYYSKLKERISEAKSEVLIAGWQISWDAQLDADGTRLLDVIRAAALRNSGVKFYIMPWKNEWESFG